MRKAIIKHVFVLSAFVCCGVSTGALAQSNGEPTPEMKLISDIENARLNQQSLERILGELNMVDSAYAPSFPRWQVDEPNLKLRVYAAFRNRGLRFSTEDAITVIANPDSQSISEIKIGDVSYGKIYIQTLLARDLKSDLLSQAAHSEPPYGFMDLYEEVSNPLARPSKPDWVAAEFSLFGGSLRFGNNWGIAARIGEDELGYTFWSVGNMRVMLSYKSLKLGAWVPINGGLHRDDKDEVSQEESSSRLLNGTFGVVGEFEFEWNLIRIKSDFFPYAAIGGKFGFGTLPGRRETFYTPNRDSLRYISVSAQAYYAFDVLFDEKQQNLNVHLGVSYHKVNLGKALPVGGVEDKMVVFEAGPPETFIDPYVRIEYRYARLDRFRVTAQYSNLLMLVGWAEIVPPFIYVEVKYSAPAFRNRRPWEHKSYLYATAGFKFDF